MEGLVMARLFYAAIMSLDGYVADDGGNFDWAAPDGEVHTFINDLVRPVGTYLYGRRMYETMAGWETEPTFADQSRVARDFAEIWRAADKVVYSRTLETTSTTRTRIERDFDVDSVRQMTSSAARDLTVGGPDLAAHAFKAGLVDECHLFIAPAVVGERRFGNGMVHLRYLTKTP
jgi:dihydrofolate reductase